MSIQNIESKTPTDKNGVEIKVGAIVQITGEDLVHDGKQGLVVNTDSDVEYDGKLCNVVVFFYQEVPTYNFAADSTEVYLWDDKYKDQCRASDTSFILENDLWKKCPRIQYFSPKEILIQKNWSLKNLIGRVFNGSMEPHTHYSFKGVTMKSDDYMCFRKECNNVASKIAIFNVWGSVFPLHVCDECFPKTNGWCGDSLPTLKKPLLLADGRTPFSS